MKQMMLLFCLMLGFVSSASARPRPGRECAEVNQRRYTFGLPPDIRCTGEAYGRDYDYDRPYGRSYYSDRYYGGRYGSFRREAGERVLDLGSHLGHGVIDNYLYGRRREIDGRYPAIIVDGDDRRADEERDRYRSRVEDLERELENREEEWRREESRRINREKQELDKRRRELDRQNQEVIKREQQLARRDALDAQVMIPVTNYLQFPVCLRWRNGNQVNNPTIPGGYYSLMSKHELDVMLNGYYEVTIQGPDGDISGLLVPDPNKPGGLRVKPVLGE